MKKKKLLLERVFISLICFLTNLQSLLWTKLCFTPCKCPRQSYESMFSPTAMGKWKDKLDSLALE